MTQNQIRFSQNWNNKLHNRYFTTIRLWTDEKYRYYFNLARNNILVDIISEGVMIGSAKLIKLELVKLNKISETLCYTDAGMNKQDFRKLMESMYSSKPQWDGDSTDFIILLLERID